MRFPNENRSLQCSRQVAHRGLDGVGAGTPRARLRRKQHSPRRNQPQPTSATNPLKLASFVCIKVPHTVEVMPEKHAVIACRHRAAATPLRQIITQLLAGLQIKRPLVGVKRVANYHRALQMTAMVILTRHVVILPK